MSDSLCAECDRWLGWSGGRYPDDSPGDVIGAWPDGTIILDDGVTTWNPLRALAFVAAGGYLEPSGITHKRDDRA